MIVTISVPALNSGVVNAAQVSNAGVECSACNSASADRWQNFMQPNLATSVA